MLSSAVFGPYTGGIPNNKRLNLFIIILSFIRSDNCISYDIIYYNRQFKRDGFQNCNWKLFFRWKINHQFVKYIYIHVQLVNTSFFAFIYWFHIVIVYSNWDIDILAFYLKQFKINMFKINMVVYCDIRCVERTRPLCFVS